jgi:hypothetical protein
VDAVLCPNSPHKIDDFLHLDYCGAPWAAQWYGDSGGNGGLSLRSQDHMVRCTRAWRGYGKEAPFWDGNSEDNYFTECVAHAEERNEGRICHRPEAQTFAVETIYYPTPFAIHKAWAYLPGGQTDALKRWCPEMEDARKPLN